MTDSKKPQETDLEDLFAQARVQQRKVPPDLMRRVLADAERMQPRPRANPSPQNRLSAMLRGRFAGWGVLGGMAVASCVGFWVGINPPAALDGLDLPFQAPLSGNFEGDAAELSGFGWDIEEVGT